LGTIKKVHFHITLKPQGNLQLVELDTGQYCIVHNDELLDERRWGPDQAGRAVATFQKLKAELTAGDGADHCDGKNE